MTTTPASAANERDLLPCPFCGGAPQKRRVGLNEHFAYADEVTISCNSCGAAQSAVGDTSKRGYADNSTVEARAIAAWNRRAIQQPAAEPVACHHTGPVVVPLDGDPYCVSCGPGVVPSAGSAADGWISVEDRLPEVGETVLVYAPPQSGDWPDDVRISFDCIDPNDDDHASWMTHNENYEHFCCVGKPEGSTGPREKAPYTHWHRLPDIPAIAAMPKEPT